MEQAALKLLDSGVLGIVTIFLGWAYWQERQKNSELQEKRINEAIKFLQQFDQLTTATTQAIKSLTDKLLSLGGK